MSHEVYAPKLACGFQFTKITEINGTVNGFVVQSDRKDISHIPSGVVYRLVRKSKSTVWWDKSNKWTQTDTPERTRSLSPQDYWRHGTLSHSVLQIEINRLVEWYHLTCSRDLNIHHAVSDLMHTFRNLPNNKTIRKALQIRISKTVTYRKYYEKKKQIALATGRSVQDVLKGGRRKGNVNVTNGPNPPNTYPSERVHGHEH